MGTFNSNMTAAIAKATVNALINNFRASSLFPAPYACAVSPVVPILRNAQFIYIKLNIVVPIATAPIITSPPMRPAIAISAMPNNGTVILLNVFGTASFSMLLFIFTHQS